MVSVNSGFSGVIEGIRHKVCTCEDERKMYPCVCVLGCNIGLITKTIFRPCMFSTCFADSETTRQTSYFLVDFLYKAIFGFVALLQ